MSTIPREPASELPERRRSTSRLFVREISTVPSAVVVALFAFLATWAVAKYGFGRRGDDAD
jgi:hypothetical protein